jgi:hypothetical protein
MKKVEDAISLFKYIQSNPIVIRNKPVDVNYSVHQHLQRNPLDYTPSHIILITICGCAKSPINLFQMADV